MNTIVFTQQMGDWLTGTWHWSVSGALIALTLFILLWLGQEFGVSSSLRTLCTVAGAGRHSDFFRGDWRAQSWNILFAVGMVAGGFIATQWLGNPQPVQISPDTVTHLADLGLSAPQGPGYLPPELFAWEHLSSPRVLLLLISGGFLVGFGTRWAGGCTSGHAISGLANLQWPSLVAVIGFFVGGLLMTHLFLPPLLQFLR